MNAAESIIHDTESKMEEFKAQLPADEVCHVTHCLSVVCKARHEHVMTNVDPTPSACARCGLSLQIELFNPDALV